MNRPSTALEPQSHRREAALQDIYPELIEAGVFEPVLTFRLVWLSCTVLAYATSYALLLGQSNGLLRVGCIMVAAISFMQLGLFAHEVGHGAVVRPRAWRQALGQLTSSLLIGFSFSYWSHTHPAHHRYPSTELVDPDLESLGYAFYETAARRARGLQRLAVRLQPWSVIAAFAFWAAAVRLDSLQYIRQHASRRTAVDAACMAVHFSVWLVLPIVVLGPWVACLNYAGILAVKGLYMGAILVVPHMGLGTQTASDRLPFFERQVRFSRDHKGPLAWTLICGGLDLQIEHHLLPHVACVRLPRAQPIVERYCRRQGIPYHRMGYVEACADVLAHLRRMGKLAARSGDPLTPAGTETSARAPAEHHLQSRRHAQ